MNAKIKIVFSHASGHPLIPTRFYEGFDYNFYNSIIKNHIVHLFGKDPYYNQFRGIHLLIINILFELLKNYGVINEYSYTLQDIQLSEIQYKVENYGKGWDPFKNVYYIQAKAYRYAQYQVIADVDINYSDAQEFENAFLQIINLIENQKSELFKDMYNAKFQEDEEYYFKTQFYTETKKGFINKVGLLLYKLPQPEKIFSNLFDFKYFEILEFGGEQTSPPSPEPEPSEPGTKDKFTKVLIGLSILGILTRS